MWIFALLVETPFFHLPSSVSPKEDNIAGNTAREVKDYLFKHAVRLIMIELRSIL